MIDMKKINTILSVLLLATMFIGVTGCEDDDEPGASEQDQLATLNGTWKATLIVDGASDRIEDDYAGGFTLTFNAETKTYATSGGPDKLPIPPTASFAIGSDAAHDLILDPAGLNLPVSYILTQGNNKLTMAFIYAGSGFPNGRPQVVEGAWTFEFEKQ
jgi:hypothetical protein